MPLQQTSGAASYDAFGGGAPVAAKYIEDFFQTWLRTGTGSSTTVTTGLNASINKSLVWTKSRSAATNHKLTDTARGVTKALSSNTTAAEVTDSQGLTAFSSTGYTIGTNTDYNNSGATYVDWQWVATPKFFDVVTYTGNGAEPRNISHNLGSVPGCIIVKCTSTARDWQVYHRSTPTANQRLVLNSTGAASGPFPSIWNSSPTSTVFSVGSDSTVNASGATYVAYLFAHNAGGFGLTGTDNVISCGSFTADGFGNATVSLGYEPQWLLIKKTSGFAENWFLFDTMRNNSQTGSQYLFPNTSGSESTQSVGFFVPNATGFSFNNNSLSTEDTYIYIAIRRGPMKVPTTGTSVFGLNARAGTSANATVTGGAGITDLAIIKNRSSTNGAPFFASRLTGTGYLLSSSTAAEVAAGTTILQASPWDVMDGVKVGTTSSITNANGNNFINYLIDRAPGFFDEVCYTGNAVNGRKINHNLTVAPDLMIVKQRSGVAPWAVFDSTNGPTQWLELQSTRATTASTQPWNNTSPTSSVFTVGTSNSTNGSDQTFVAYLFASAPGVSKVGSYTGTGTTQTINCGFTGGARFVLIKATDSTGNWYVWDTARGMIPANDPYLLLNSTAAEVTGTDFVDTAATGFEITSTAPAAINASGGTFIFLAIA